MGQRLELQAILVDLLGSDNVYFQPPPTKAMDYPCIRYERTDARTAFADNNPYRNTTAYLITVIDQNPDSLIPAKVADLPMCVFDRFYTADNLNHDVYKIFF
jgi:hypothetical protein